MMQPLPQQRKKSSLTWIWVLLGICTVFGGALGLFLWILTGAKGAFVGEVDMLSAQPAEVTVTAAGGDVLHFRWSTLVLDASRAGGASSRQRSTSMYNALTASTVSIQATPTGSANCPAYGGTNAKADLSSSTFDMGGVNIDCAIPITTAGTYRVRPTVAWASGLRAYTAKLEVRRAH